jgi:hypothetical protein
LTRSGGFAGLRVHAEADTDEMPGELANEAQQLLANPPASPGAPDRFVYTLRSPEREVQVGERELSPTGRQLMAWLLERTRPGS